MELDSSVYDLEHGNYDAANALVLPSKRIKHPKAPVSKRKLRILSKKQRKQLEKIVERRKKKQNRAELLLELQQHQLPQSVYDSFTPLVKIQTEGLKKLFAESAKKDSNKAKLRQSTREEDKNEEELLETMSDSDLSDSEENTGEDSESEKESTPNDTDSPNNSISENVSVVSEDIRIENKDIPANVSDKKLHVQAEVKKFKCAPRPHSNVPVYRTSEIEQARSKLPIIPEEQVIMEAISENMVTILAGETGSGKTTQLPQFLYEAGYANSPKIIGITEPRRVAAIAMAHRVAKELNLSSQEVSYQIRFEGNTSKKTRIKFMTDGVLLKEMEKDFILSKYSVICVDEAHERSLFTDILIGLLSRVVYIREKRNDPLKLVVMSATLRIEDFTMNKSLFPRIPAVIHVPTRQFPVQTHFSKTTPKNYMEAAYKKVLQIHKRLPAGGILVFVTGQEEVKQLCSQLKHGNKGIGSKIFSRKRSSAGTSTITLKEFDLDKINATPAKGKRSDSDDESENSDMEEDEEDSSAETLHIVPLYSMLSVKDQQKVFAPPPPNSRLCVVATNVAETSLTIPSVRYVVDTGKVKLKLWDKLTGVQTFHVSWASKASAEQRAGRAGRTGPGHCYRLYSSAVFHTEFIEFSEPEIKIRPVEDMVLLMKAMSINRVRSFPYPTHPGDAQLAAAEKLLLKLGAIEIPRGKSVPGKIDVTRITSLGKTMAHLPVSPRFSRMIAISFSHSVLEYVITLVAALSVKEILLETPEDHLNPGQSKKWVQIRRKWAGAGSSLLLGDCTVLLRAVGAFERDGGTAESCLKYGLRLKAMQEIRKLRKQLSTDINMIVNPNQETVLDPQMKPPTDEQSNILRQIILSGFPDRIAHRIPEDEIPGGEAKKYKNSYRCGELKDPVFLHSESVLRGVHPEWVVYQEAYDINGKIYLRGVTCIDPRWIPTIAPTSDDTAT